MRELEWWYLGVLIAVLAEDVALSTLIDVASAPHLVTTQGTLVVLHQLLCKGEVRTERVGGVTCLLALISLSHPHCPWYEGSRIGDWVSFRVSYSVKRKQKQNRRLKFVIEIPNKVFF